MCPYARVDSRRVIATGGSRGPEARNSGLASEAENSIVPCWFTVDPLNADGVSANMTGGSPVDEILQRLLPLQQLNERPSGDQNGKRASVSSGMVCASVLSRRCSQRVWTPVPEITTLMPSDESANSAIPLVGVITDRRISCGTGSVRSQTNQLTPIAMDAHTPARTHPTAGTR